MKAGAWLIAGMGLVLAFGRGGEVSSVQTRARERTVGLPGPVLDGGVSLERALRERRSVREYARAPLSLAEVGQLAWAAQGQSAGDGRRTAPSAGALYPLELYVVAGEVDGLEPGVYRYRPATHHLLALASGDVREALCAAAAGQAWVREAPCLLVLAALHERTTARYGRRGERYVHMEAGHAAQNAWLEATALGLGAVLVGAFDDEDIRRGLGLDRAERPLALLAVGRRR